jgi:DNA-binding phage protein
MSKSMIGDSFNRSILYNITPQGIGTFYSESLTSYLIRLAGEHCVEVGRLINKLLAKHLNKEYLLLSSHRGGNRFYDIAKTLNGYMENSSDFVNLLELSTGRDDLKRLTLSGLKNVVPTRGLLKDFLSFCPMCINNWKENGVPYYPLSWLIKDVMICPIHHIQLCNECPNCKSPIDILHRRSQIGYCPRCHAWIGDHNILNEITSIDFNYWIAVNVGYLTSINLTDEVIARERHIQVLELISRDFFSNNIAKFARDIEVPRVTLDGWIKGNAIPTFRRQLEICHRYSISLANYYTNQDINIFEFGKGTQYEMPLVEEKNKKVIRNNNYEVLKQELLSYTNVQESISVSEVARRIGINKRILYIHFPEICYRISEKYREHIKNQKQARIERAILDIRNAFKELCKVGIYPSRRKIEQYLCSPGILKEHEIKRVWHDLLEVYFEKGEF